MVDAYLFNDGKLKRTCVECALMLRLRGMLTPIIEDEHVAVFVISPGVTLAECQAAIEGTRH